MPTFASGYDRPARNRHGSRSPTTARHGMVATSHALATLTGVEVLKSGGNAVDAAIAANAMLTVVEPMSCGLGGDLFAIYWDAGQKQLFGLNGSGRSPLEISREKLVNGGLRRLPTSGPLSWSVPGCVAGWEDLRARFGKRPLRELLEPAAQAAEEGHAVSEVVANLWAGSAAGLSAWRDSAETWLVSGRAPRQGEIFRNPRLAATLRLIGEQGADAFYRGSIAERIVAFSQRNEGYFSLRDFADHTSTWIDPVSTNYRGYDVWELPPNGQGIAALQMLNLLEPYDLAEMGFGSAEYAHLLIEAKKLAFADRARFYADPAFAAAPVKELISKEYARERGKRLHREQAARDVPPGDPQLKHGDTICLSVIDAERNCCSLIQSVYYGFGSQVAPGDVGFCLQNRGALFALDENHPNRLLPGKRPFHTIIPGMVTRDGQPWLSFGVMGGDFQPQGHVQVLCNQIDFGMHVQEAGDAPRISHNGGATPTGDSDQSGGSVAVESGIPAATLDRLRGWGHQADYSAGGGYGGYQAIRIDAEHGTLWGGSDPRKDGCALGY